MSFVLHAIKSIHDIPHVIKCFEVEKPESMVYILDSTWYLTIIWSSELQWVKFDWVLES